MASKLSVLAICTLGVFSVAFGQINYSCLASNCGKEMQACSFDENCFPALVCLSSCGDDQECSMRCLATYHSDAFNNFVECSMGRSKCIVVPVKPVVCKKPQLDKLAVNFDMKYLTGKFYNVLGMNQLFECRDYTFKNFKARGDDTLILTERVDLPMRDGKPRTFEDTSLYSNAGTESPSIINTSPVSGPMRREDEYRVLSFSETHVFVYYCGKNYGIGYEGAYVMSRSPELSEEDRLIVKTEATRNGWDVNQFCVPKQKAVV